MQLTYTDCLLYPTQITNKDLENLAFFGTTSAIMAASLDEKTNIKEQWEKLFSIEVSRLQRVGIIPHITLGLPAEYAPKHLYRELLIELETLLSQQKIAALGPLSLGTLPRHQEAFVTQLRLAQNHSLPCVIALPTRGKLPYMDTVLSLAKKENLAPEQIAFLHSTGKTIVRARTFGAHNILTVHPSYLKTKTTAALIQRQGTQKLMLASSLGPGPGDVLALQKLALVLGELEVSGEEILQVTQTNASRFFGFDKPQK